MVSNIDKIRLRLEEAPADLLKKIPSHTLTCIKQYVLHDTQQGHFLTAVLSNDLYEAVARGDLENQRAIVPIVQFLYSYCPQACFGDKDKVQEWQEYLAGFNKK